MMRRLYLSFIILTSGPVLSRDLISETRLQELNQIFISKRVGGPAPIPGSKVDRVDIKTIIKIQAKATEAEIKRANAEASCSLQDFFGLPYGFLNSEQVHLSTEIYSDIFHSSDQLTNKIKDAYLRVRPALRTDLVPNPIQKLVRVAPRTSYPSGHTGIAMTTALVFSKIFPNRKAFLLDRAKQIGFGRVLGGVHHPSDVKAAYLVGKLVASELLKRPEFLIQLADLCNKLNPGKHCLRINELRPRSL